MPGTDHLGDTTLEAERVHIAVLKRLGGSGRAEMILQLCAGLRQVTEEGVRQRHPDYDDDAVRLAMIRLTTGEELFRRLFPGLELKP